MAGVPGRSASSARRRVRAGAPPIAAPSSIRGSPLPPTARHGLHRQVRARTGPVHRPDAAGRRGTERAAPARPADSVRHGITPDQGTTSGAQSHPANFNKAGLALAAATARQALLGWPPTRLGVPAEQLTARDGAISVTADASRRVTLRRSGRRPHVRDAARCRRAREAIPSEWTVLGQPVPRARHSALVTAQARVRAQRPRARHAARPSRASTGRRRDAH